MDKHALAILKSFDFWNWPTTKRIQERGGLNGELESVTPKLLYYLVLESQNLGTGGQVLDHFWYQLGKCDDKLKVNIEGLKQMQFISATQTFRVLFRGLDHKKVKYDPVLNMAAEYFTHLGAAFMIPEGGKSGESTASSISEIAGKETEELLKEVNEEGDFGKRKQESLKILAFRRDGTHCLLTQMEYRPFDLDGIYPALAHIIPNSVHDKPATLKCIAMFAGTATSDEVVRNLNGMGNVMLLQLDAHASYDDLYWGIEAKSEGSKVKYLYRRIPTVHNKIGPAFIRLKDGDEIEFGKGPGGEELDIGPLPTLCNLRLAVARVMKMSGAAEIILKWKNQADDDGLSHLFVASQGFCGMLDAKLFLSGRAFTSV